MFRLLFLLSSTMFVVLLIAGEDRGQMRHGLIATAPREEAPAATLAEAPVAEPLPDVNLASFVPLSPPTPQPAVQRQEPAPEPVQTMMAAPSPEATRDLVIDAVADEGMASSPQPLLFVNSNAINVRQGPSTDYAVVGRLTRNESVLAVEPEQNGWVRIRIEGDGVEGFVAARLLTDRDPLGN